VAKSGVQLIARRTGKQRKAKRATVLCESCRKKRKKKKEEYNLFQIKAIVCGKIKKERVRKREGLLKSRRTETFCTLPKKQRDE
jgi:hypothetical protein